MGKLIIWLIVGLLIGLIVGGIAGYLIANNFHPNNFQRGGNFQLNQDVINQINSFFDSTKDINEIRSYCEQNRMNCFYYCRNINQNHEICKELSNFTQRQGGVPPQ